MNNVAAVLKALEAGTPSDVFKFGIGRGFSVRDVVNAVERCTGLTVLVQVWTRRAGDPAALVSDAMKARQALGWAPEIDDLDEIVRTAWGWHQKSQNLSARTTAGF